MTKQHSEDLPADLPNLPDTRLFCSSEDRQKIIIKNAIATVVSDVSKKTIVQRHKLNTTESTMQSSVTVPGIYGTVNAKRDLKQLNKNESLMNRYNFSTVNATNLFLTLELSPCHRRMVRYPTGVKIAISLGRNFQIASKSVCT